jgi:hypothetical protein
VQTGCLTAALFDAAPGSPAAILATRPSGGIVVNAMRPR